MEDKKVVVEAKKNRIKMWFIAASNKQPLNLLHNNIRIVCILPVFVAFPIA